MHTIRRLPGLYRTYVACAAACSALAGPVHAGSADDAKGWWLTAAKDAVIEFAPCPGQTASLCGKIVWDRDAGTPTDTCGIEIAKLARYQDDAWRDGWVYDPRSKKTYRATVRSTGPTLAIRAFIGVEILGETEQLTRIDALPAGPACKPQNHFKP